jgi:hypothetical protein
MKHITWIIPLSLLACGWLFLPPPPAAAQSVGMACIDCHADTQGGGGFHGSFRPLTNFTKDQVEVICLSCHDGTLPAAPEAAVHEQTFDGQGKAPEYGTFKAGCLDCHRTHPTEGGLAGDGSLNTNLQLYGREVVEASSTDGVARVRKPIIDDSGTPADLDDDTHIGWECDSGIPDDPACIESDPPAAGDGVRGVAFYGALYEGGDWLSNGGRNPWADTAAPYRGACNPCHTRTGHHRRDDSGGDHGHNIPKAGCVECHHHDAGFLDKGG